MADQAETAGPALDPALVSLCLIAGYYRVPADPAQLKHQLALLDLAKPEDAVRGSRLLGLRARIVSFKRADRLGTIPYPALLFLKDGGSAVLAAASEKGKVRLLHLWFNSLWTIGVESLFTVTARVRRATGLA